MRPGYISAIVGYTRLEWAELILAASESVLHDGKSILGLTTEDVWWLTLSVRWECILGYTHIYIQYMDSIYHHLTHTSPVLKQPLDPYNYAIKQNCLKRVNRSDKWINTTPVCVFYVASLFHLFLPTWSTGWGSQSHGQKPPCMGVEVLRASLHIHTRATQ